MFQARYPIERVMWGGVGLGFMGKVSECSTPERTRLTMLDTITLPSNTDKVHSVKTPVPTTPQNTTVTFKSKGCSQCWQNHGPPSYRLPCVLSSQWPASSKSEHGGVRANTKLSRGGRPKLRNINDTAKTRAVRLRSQGGGCTSNPRSEVTSAAPAVPEKHS